MDISGIPGWDKVDALARALIDLQSQAVMNTQAKDI